MRETSYDHSYKLLTFTISGLEKVAAWPRRAREMPGPKICEVGGGGLFLPLFGDSEQLWDNKLRAFLYFIGLLWSFLGVAIVADIFMAAIEQVTSKTRPITMTGKDGTQKTYHVQIWNGTVANLTLMALGSSAPEILLAVIETLSNKFYSGDLGPSTIVGSAAYNLCCILGEQPRSSLLVLPRARYQRTCSCASFITHNVFHHPFPSALLQPSAWR